MSLIDIQLVDFLEDNQTLKFHYPLGGAVTEGTKNLIQLVIKRILTVRGSNELEPTVGSNFYGLFGTIDYQDVENIKSTFPIMLENMVSNIKEEQLEAESQGLSLTNEEKLRNLTMENIEYDEIFSGWLITIKVETEANQFFVVTL